MTIPFYSQEELDRALARELRRIVARASELARSHRAVAKLPAAARPRQMNAAEALEELIEELTLHGDKAPAIRNEIRASTVDSPLRRDCTCNYVAADDKRCRGVGTLGDGWRCVRLGRGPLPEERAEVERRNLARRICPATFIDRCLRGEVDNPDAAIDDAVSAWHEGDSVDELHVYLGMTDEEYSRWVIDPAALATILEERRAHR